MEAKLETLWLLMKEVHSQLCDEYQEILRHRERVELIKQMQHKDKRVILNVGGTKFETQRRFLCGDKAVDTMFFAIGEGWFDDWGDTDEIFIDRDGTLFSVILDWLRSESTTGAEYLLLLSEKLTDFDHATELQMITREAAYYGLTALVTAAQKQSMSTHCRFGLAQCKEEFYHKISPFKVRVKKEHDSHVIPVSSLFIEGTRTTLDIAFFHSQNIKISLYDWEGVRMLVWYNNDTEESALLVESSPKHIFSICLDWTHRTSDGEWRLAIEATLDGVVWEPTKMQTEPAKATRFVSLWLASLTGGSEVELLGLQEEEVQD
eukprot:TRINITY_DN58475_c0_g1_i1.p2 TRINITY_DN58475_c0_g1~~TRINITY_DN58475_c0_g1_i1.p2  ORF type:complete len:320 (-),score=23.06 TRINITY_DN58475_c0_g1_i1:1229-2188(-)